MSDDHRPKQVFYNARELFSTPGYAPYQEPDKLVPKGPYERTLIHLGYWRSYIAMRISASSLRAAAKSDKLNGVGRLAASAGVVS